jgi:ElaA protein
MTASTTWHTRAFNELSPIELYSLLRLRSAVFVVEQQCLFEDIDGKDATARHLIAIDNGEVVAYSRLYPPGVVYEEASIGRVATAMRVRRTGLGRELMTRSIGAIETHWGKVPIRIGAQAYLRTFYESFGFRVAGDGYIEDGIPHFQMLRPYW